MAKPCFTDNMKMCFHAFRIQDYIIFILYNNGNIKCLKRNKIQ